MKAFSNDFVYSLIFHQNLVSSSFLKIGCNVESEGISVDISPSIKIDWFILYFQWIFSSCMNFW